MRIILGKNRWKISGLWPGGIAAVVFFGMYHFQDTRAGAMESGDFWLEKNYLLLLLAAVLFTAVSGYLFLGGEREEKKAMSWPLERIYPVCALILGTLYLCVLPPLSAPDEVSHYISAYKLSNQLMGKKAADENGLVYIRGEDAFIENVDKRTREDPDGDTAEVNGGKILGQTLDESTYATIHEKGFGGAGEEETAVSGQWAVRTTPLAYVPQAIGITLARLFHLGGIGLLFMGRLFNLLFYTAVTWMAMKKLPFGKEVLFGAALLPMTLHLSASMSYDVMILALSFYFTACCLHLAYRAEMVRPIDVAVLAAVLAVLTPCKIVYVFLAGLCFLIPIKKLGDWKKYLLSAAVVLAAMALSMLLVNSQTIAVYTGDSGEYVAWADEAGYTFSQLIHNQSLLFEMFYNTILWQAEQYHLTMIGAYLGNMDVVLDVPYILVAGFTLALFGLALRKTGEKLEIIKGKRRWIRLVCLCCTGAAMFSMLLAWTPLSSKIISGVQGRYFLPFLPVLLISLKNDLVVMTESRNRELLYLMCCANSYILIRLYSIVSIRI